MKFWLHIHNTDPEGMMALARLAEDVGFEGVLGDDHWFMPAQALDQDPNERGPLPCDTVFPDMFVAGAAILAQTRTLKFGTCVLVLGNRTNPFLVAKAAATLARLSGDRFVMGVGTGWMREEYAMSGVDWASRVPRTVEMIEVLRTLWGESPVSYQGKFFEFPPIYALPAPRKQIPIYIGSIAPAALRRTGRIADGWMGMTARLEDLPAQIAQINAGRAEAGRAELPFEFMVGLARNPDGTLPSKDDYRRAEDLGITQGHVGPIEHMLGKPYPTIDEKTRAVRAFAERILT